jgi:hypothetical protein
MHIQRYEIEQNRLLGTTTMTKALTWAMLRLPRPFALALLLSLRNGGLLLMSGRQPAVGV